MTHDEGWRLTGGGGPLRSVDDDCRMTRGRYRFRETIRSPPVAARLRTRPEKNLLPLLLVSDAFPPFVHTFL